MSKLEVVNIDSPSGESVLTVGGTNSNTVNVEGTDLTLGKSGGTVAPAAGATVSGFGLFTSYAIIADQKAQNVPGGSFTSGAWRTRDLNTEIADPDGIVSISANQFTLGAGTYLIKWAAPTYGVGDQQARLYNVTDASVEGVGMSNYASQAWVSTGSARVTIAGSKAFSIEHRCQSTYATGFGYEANFSSTEQYTIVEIFKEA